MVQGAIRSFMLSFISAMFVDMGGYPSKYTAEAMEVWIANADTKQPPEDVIVITSALANNLGRRPI